MVSLYSLHKRKEAGLLGERTCMKAAIDSEFLMRRLSKSQVLKGHNGCVNTVAWNESGTRIMSGSDDCHLKIYDAGSGLVHKSVHTTHRSNIFSAKFLPGYCDLRTVSCAGIGSVEYSEFTPDGEYIGHPFHCQNSITYQVATTPRDPNEFLTCEERGNVRLYDLRVRSSCNCQGCKRDVLYSFPASVTSIAIHPLSPSYIAFALGDGSVRLLDRRMTKDLIGKIDLPDLADRATVKQYKPYSIGTQPHKITSIQFNSVGSELLVSYSEDYVYLFNSRLFHVGPISHDTTTIRDGSGFLSRPVYLSQLESYSPGHRRKRSSFVKRKPLSNYGESPPTSSSKPAPNSDSVPPAKKLRLRGDWSDTGPEARPDVDSEGGGGRGRGHLMNRMSRMFAQWIDMSLSPGSNNESSSDREDVPDSYRHRRNRRVPTTPTYRDGASPSASSVASSNDSFQLFDSDDNETEVGERGEERGEGGSREHPASLDGKEDIFSLTVESPNGSTTKSEGTATMNVSTVSERPRTPTQPTGDLKHDKMSDSLSTIEHQNDGEKSDAKVDTSLVVDTEPRFASSDSEEDKSSNSRKYRHDFRTHVTKDARSPMQEDGGAQSTRVEGSAALDMAVMIENRTKNSSPDSAPAVIVEGETDSDDTEECGSYDESNDYQKRSHDDDDNGMLHSQYFMRYKGHRNSRTMIKQANFWGENWVLSGSDCGRVFIWDKWSGKVVNLLMADSHVVNCVQPHPSAYVLATSGIDYDIKLWEPLSAVPCSLGNLQEVVDRNEVMLEESRNTITVPSMFVFRILAYLHRRRRMQQAQDEPVDEESD